MSVPARFGIEINDEVWRLAAGIAAERNTAHPHVFKERLQKHRARRRFGSLNSTTRSLYRPLAKSPSLLHIEHTQKCPAREVSAVSSRAELLRDERLVGPPFGFELRRIFSLLAPLGR